MNYITDMLMIVGGTLLFSTVRDLVISARTPKLKTPYDQTPYDHSHEFQPLYNVYCPKCNTNWNFKYIKYCSCEEYHVGHFHMECKGTANRGLANEAKDYGCHYEWIMRSKT